MSECVNSDRVTGTKVKELREALHLTHSHFSQVLGVHVGTVYRWEAAGERAVRIEPFQLQVLAVIQAQVKATGATGDLGGTILQALLTRGPLFGLFKLLESAFSTPVGTTRE